MSTNDFPPELFGIDPEETWEYTLKASRHLPEEKRVVLTLATPDAALDHLMDSDEAKLRAEIAKRVPNAVATIQRLNRKANEKRKAEGEQDENRPVSDYLTAEENEERTKALQAYAEAAIAAEIDDPRNFETMRRVLGACVKSWRGLRTAKGVVIARPEKDADVMDRLPKAARVEVYEAIRGGMQITEKEMASLQ